MTKLADPELESTQALLEDLRRYEEEVRALFETALEEEATRQEVTGRWPFTGGWHTLEEIRRFRRHAWFRWVVVRLEAVMLIALTLGIALVGRLLLLQFLPK